MVVLINTETHKVAIIWVVAIIGACTLDFEFYSNFVAAHKLSTVPSAHMGEGNNKRLMVLGV